MHLYTVTYERGEALLHYQLGITWVMLSALPVTRGPSWMTATNVHHSSRFLVTPQHVEIELARLGLRAPAPHCSPLSPIFNVIHCIITSIRAVIDFPVYIYTRAPSRVCPHPSRNIPPLVFPHARTVLSTQHSPAMPNQHKPCRLFFFFTFFPCQLISD
ncbi:hypothetical protein BGY98DRAFT_94063 [Russula aff. rugulosa BPL654]|nr:hypothetical protein BGY98DRAFT_94063 [Russula aff. rugulosa BPL654]